MRIEVSIWLKVTTIICSNLKIGFLYYRFCFWDWTSCEFTKIKFMCFKYKYFNTNFLVVIAFVLGVLADSSDWWKHLNVREVGAVWSARGHLLRRHRGELLSSDSARGLDLLHPLWLDARRLHPLRLHGVWW